MSNPALAVHEQMLESHAYEAFWIGRNEQRERAVVEAEGFPFLPSEAANSDGTVR